MPDDNQVQVQWHEHVVSREERESLNGHKGCVVWFTGLSASGKSTVANLVDHKLCSRGAHSFVLDGDNVRHGLNAAPALLAQQHGEEFGRRFGLGFSAQDREENIRRIAAVAKLFCDAGIIAITAFISPFRADRDRARAMVCGRGLRRDLRRHPAGRLRSSGPKGMYKKARAGQIKGFTGIDDPYEPPQRPEMVLQGGDKPAEALANEVLAYLEDRRDPRRPRATV